MLPWVCCCLIYNRWKTVEVLDVFFFFQKGWHARRRLVPAVSDGKLMTPFTAVNGNRMATWIQPTAVQNITFTISECFKRCDQNLANEVQGPNHTEQNTVHPMPGSSQEVDSVSPAVVPSHLAPRGGRLAAQTRLGMRLPKSSSFSTKRSTSGW